MSTLFSDGQLAELSAFFVAQGCKDDVNILRESRTPDNQLGARATWPIHETVKALVIEHGIPRLQVVAQQNVAQTEKQFCFPPGTDVLRADRFGYQGDTYEVIDALDPTTYTVFLRFTARKMEAGS